MTSKSLNNDNNNNNNNNNYLLDNNNYLNFNYKNINYTDINKLLDQSIRITTYEIVSCLSSFIYSIKTLLLRKIDRNIFISFYINHTTLPKNICFIYTGILLILIAFSIIILKYLIIS